MRIGFIGTGLMGFPMAEKLLEAGHDLIVFNRTIEKAAPLADSGAEICEDMDSIYSKSECIIIMLTNYYAIQQIFANLDSDLKGKTIIQMSTIAPEESRELQSHFNEFGAEYFEAPVLGSIPQIRSKSLITLVGSTRDQFDNWQDLFSAFSNRVEYIGEVGKASSFKLGLNQLIVGLTTVFSMSLGYIRAKGLNVEKFMGVVRESALYASTFDKKLPNMLERDFSNPNFPLKHLLKDLNLMLDEFSSAGIDVETLKGIQSVIEKGIKNGNGEKDYSSLYEAVHILQ